MTSSMASCLRARRPFSFDDPIDPRVFVSGAKRRNRGERMQNVAESREPHNQISVPRLQSLRMRRTASVKFSASASGCLAHFALMQLVFAAPVSGHHRIPRLRRRGPISRSA